jgi:rhodanese-related sulfurtransferase/DNA-binding transcriptional ArsR family regulator
MTLEELPNTLYEHFAEIGQALSNSTRLRALNLLAQTERSVDDLAAKLDQSVANTSAHLKVLRRANLIGSRKQGRRVYYRIASREALQLFLALRDTGMEQVPEAREQLQRHAQEPALLPDLDEDALLEKVHSGEVTLVDLRPTEEFEAGHIPTARSVPFAELEQWVDSLPDDREIVAYCRGPYCVAAIKGVQGLRDAGLPAHRVRFGIAEWKARNLPLETSAQETT